MSDRRRKGRITVQHQPTRETRLVQRLAAIPCLVVAVFFVIIGVTVVIPGAGLFGVVWTFVAACFAVIGVVNLVRRDGLAHRVAYDVEPAREDEQVIERFLTGQPAEGEPSAGTAAPPAPERGPESVEERLTALRSLYDKNLITRDEYQAKRKEILEDL